jgi:NAD(P)H-flavin reductase
MSAQYPVTLAPLTPIPTRVRECRRETHDVFSLVLDAPTKGYQFQPGQFNMLYVFGVGEAAISVSGDSGDTISITHTIRAVGPVTHALSKLNAGNIIGVRGPFGSGWPLEAARGQDIVMVTGGIGLAPLRSLLLHISRHRSDFGQVTLLQGIRRPDDYLFAANLQEWSRIPDVRVLVTAAQADSTWRGHVGVVTSLFSQIEFDPGRTLGFMCGPEIMMRFTAQEFQRRGIADERMYLAMERNMQCAVGFCGHCQFGPNFVCMDGPVFRYDRIRDFFTVREA